MEIQVNGRTHDVADQLTATQLVEILGLADRRLAMEVNREIVPRSTFDIHFLRPGDQVEIVHAIGGG